MDQGGNSRSGAIDRRQFIQGVGATAALALAAPSLGWAAATKTADALVAGKDARLIVHTVHPVVMETPAELLAAQQVTPTALLFVRNTQQQPDGTAHLRPQSLEGWKVDIAGLIEKPLSIEGQQLTQMPQVEVEMVLQCSGNSRALFNPSAKVKGTAWGRGGMGNVRFGGVRLQSLIDKLGIKIKPEARYLSAEGIDRPDEGEQDFEHSLPLADALDRSFLALTLNGQPLPAAHGGPVRLVTPGYYGTMNVKWLHRVRFDAAESDHTSQIPNYRTPLAPIAPGSPFVPTLANSEPNWRMKIKSVVLSPSSGAQLPASEVEVCGVAFNDGAARIDAMLTSIDGGRSWQKAELQVPESPYAWYRWQSRLKMPAGKQQIWARAVDALGRTQPLDGAVHWNPQGYTWNGVEKIDVTVAG